MARSISKKKLAALQVFYFKLQTGLVEIYPDIDRETIIDQGHLSLSGDEIFGEFLCIIGEYITEIAPSRYGFTDAGKKVLTEKSE